MQKGGGKAGVLRLVSCKWLCELEREDVGVDVQEGVRVIITMSGRLERGDVRVQPRRVQTSLSPDFPVPSTLRAAGLRAAPSLTAVCPTPAAPPAPPPPPASATCTSGSRQSWSTKRWTSAPSSTLSKQRGAWQGVKGPPGSPSAMEERGGVKGRAQLVNETRPWA